MIVLYIFMMIGLAIAMTRAGFNMNLRRTYGVGRSEFNALSWPSKQILKEYRQIPPNNRPYANVLHAVKALDIKYEVDEVNRHFSRNTYDGTIRTWNCNCYNGCRYHSEYVDIHEGIKEVQKSLVEQQRSLAIAGVSGGLEDAEAMINSLHEERKLINTVTRELA